MGTTRIIGLDVARAWAVIGMIVVNFKLVLGKEGASWLQSLVGFLDGKAAATFVVLAGVGIALMTRKARASQDATQWRQLSVRLAKRALFLWVLGLSYWWIWPADILHYYAIYMLVIMLVWRWRPTVALWVALAMILLYPLLFLVLDYEAHWNFVTLEYEGFWTVTGFLRNLLVDGFHPVLPWAAFMLVGYWYGCQDLRDEALLKKTLYGAGLGWLLVQGLSWGAIEVLSEGQAAERVLLGQVLGMSPMPPFPFYMLNGICSALFVIALGILWGLRQPTAVGVVAFAQTGQLALTFYVLHVLLGMGLVEVWAPEQFGQHSLTFSVGYALVFSLCCMGVAALWKRYFKEGPLEALLRRLTH